MTKHKQNKKNYELLDDIEKREQRETRLQELFQELFKIIPLQSNTFNKEIPVSASTIKELLQLKRKFPEIEIGGEEGYWYISYSMLISLITRILWDKSVMFTSNEERKLIGITVFKPEKPK